MDHTKMRYYLTNTPSSSTSRSHSDSCYYRKDGKSQIHLENVSRTFKKCKLSFEKWRSVAISSILNDMRHFKYALSFIYKPNSWYKVRNLWTEPIFSRICLYLHYNATSKYFKLRHAKLTVTYNLNNLSLKIYPTTVPLFLYFGISTPFISKAVKIFLRMRHNIHASDLSSVVCDP